MRRIRFLVWKELIELRRDRRLFAIVIMAPIIQLLLLGYAATTDVRNVPVVVADLDRSNHSRELVRRFAGSRSFSVVSVVGDAEEAGHSLEDGRAWIVLAIPRGFGEAMTVGRPETLQLVADGSDANSAGISIGYANSLLASYAQEVDSGAGVGSRPGRPRRRDGRGCRATRRRHDRAADPRLVQPPPREPGLHDPGHRRAPAAGRHDESVVDGHCPRARARHAGAAQRHAAPPSGAHHRQVAALRAGGTD